MMQRHHATKPGRFSKCPCCGRQPQHVEHYGRTRLETMNFAIPAHRHSLECACGRTTARHNTLADAEAEWGLLQSQIPLRLVHDAVPLRRGRKAKAVQS